MQTDPGHLEIQFEFMMMAVEGHPTVLRLVIGNWFRVHDVVKDKLKEIGRKQGLWG
jgi:hypothetical protein